MTNEEIRSRARDLVARMRVKVKTYRERYEERTQYWNNMRSEILDRILEGESLKDYELVAITRELIKCNKEAEEDIQKIKSACTALPTQASESIEMLKLMSSASNDEQREIIFNVVHENVMEDQTRHIQESLHSIFGDNISFKAVEYKVDPETGETLAGKVIASSGDESGERKTFDPSIDLDETQQFNPEIQSE